VLGVPLAAFALWVHTRGPASLAEVQLVGPRGPEPLNVVLVLDESGSFAEYADVRAQLLDQFVDWSHDNLRPDDTLTVVAFAGDSATRIRTTSVSALPEVVPYDPIGLAADDTLVRPALEEAAGVTSAASIDGPVTLVVLTDTIVSDLDSQSTSDVDQLVDDLDAFSMTVIVPDGVDVTSQWHESFPWALELEAGLGSSNETALAIGSAMAHATGQRLEKR
jgi:Mg-chelatase subunit ChlD